MTCARCASRARRTSDSLRSSVPNSRATCEVNTPAMFSLPSVSWHLTLPLSRRCRSPATCETSGDRGGGGGDALKRPLSAAGGRVDQEHAKGVPCRYLQGDRGGKRAIGLEAVHGARLQGRRHRWAAAIAGYRCRSRQSGTDGAAGLNTLDRPSARTMAVACRTYGGEASEAGGAIVWDASNKGSVRRCCTAAQR